MKKQIVRLKIRAISSKEQNYCSQSWRIKTIWRMDWGRWLQLP